jgi:hypothetical protein
MLQIVDFVELPDGQLVVDEYVPFRFRLSGEALPEPFLWQTGNFTTSLFEMKIARDTGIVAGLTLTLFSQRPNLACPIDVAEAAIVEGIPVVDRSLFAKGRFAEGRPFSVTQLPDSVIVSFDESLPISRLLVNGRVGFLESHSKLSGVWFKELTEHEMQLLSQQFQPPTMRQ